MNIDPAEQTLLFLKREHKLFINGKWVEPTSEDVLMVENPATEKIVAQVGAASTSDLDSAVSFARTAFESVWRDFNPSARARILLKVADLIEQNAEQLAEIETIENGMPKFVSMNTLTDFCAELFRYYAGWVTKLTGETLPAVPNGRADQDWLVYTLREPVGVVGAILPWNAPYSMLSLKIAPALAAGCTIVMKPAELTPLTAIRIAEVLQEAGVPDGVFNLVQGRGAQLGAALAAHDGVDKISFTGSTQTGKAIVQASTGNLKRVSLELGGKSPFIVFDDANLEQAIPGAAMGGFFLTGQNCMAATRLFVEETIHDEFVAGVAQFAATMTVGNGMHPETMLGPLISQDHKAKVQSFVTAAIEAGADPVPLPAPIPDSGYFFSPTILANVTPDMDIAQSEVFGPVLAVQKFSKDDTAGLLRATNATNYGLSGSVWTSDLAMAHQLVRRIDSGQVAINAHAAVSPETPFGGNRQSGWGREFGRDGIDAYLKTKAISVNLAPLR